MNVNLSFGDFVDNVFDNFRRITPAFLAVEVTAGFILFAPRWMLEKLYLTDLPTLLLKWVGIVFIISSFLLIINIFSFAIERVKSMFCIKKMGETLPGLTFMERKMISLMYYSPSNSLLMSIHGQTKGALEAKRIIIRTTSISSDVGYMTFSYMLHPWVVRYINKHPDFLTMTDEESKNEYQEYYRNLDNGNAY